MGPEEIVRDVMHAKGFSYAKLADKLGYATASVVSDQLRRKNGMRTDNFVKMLEAMDCEIVVKDKIGKKQSWKVDNE